MIQPAIKSQEFTNFSLAEDIFGREFEVWAFDQRWHRIRNATRRLQNTTVDFYLELIDLLNSACRLNHLQLHHLDDGRVLCLLPLGEDGRRVVALRVIYATSEDFCTLAQRAAAAAVVQQQRTRQVRQQLLDSDSKLAAWATRISQGNAELEWLHQLSISTEVSGSNDSPDAVARRILPEMCRLARARSVVYIGEPDDSDDGQTPMSIWQTGEVHVPDSVCLSLIADAGRHAVGPPVIRSFPVPVHARHPFPGVLSCIVKAVTRDAKRFGWILVVNKDLQYLVQHDPFERSATAIQRECEFGHFESGLVEAAANAISAHARNSSLLRQKELLFEGAIRSLVNAIDAKDSYTCGHSDRVAEYAREIARTMGMSETFCEQIYMTGLLHDVGKIGVPDDVLQKPGKLTDEEFDSIKQHPVIGHDILRHLGEFDYVLPGVLHHHESIDGSGYPDGLVGEEIPLMARILAVADAYDAMTSDRPYRAGMPTARAEKIINDGAGHQWDRNCVEAFRQCLHGLKMIGHQRHERVTDNVHVR